MIEISGVQYEEDWLIALEQSFDQFLNNLQAFDEDDEPVTETENYYCGCQTCFNREVLAFLLPKVAVATKAGRIIV